MTALGPSRINQPSTSAQNVFAMTAVSLKAAMPSGIFYFSV
jgi:hypothetical protein